MSENSETGNGAAAGGIGDWPDVAKVEVLCGGHLHTHRSRILVTKRGFCKFHRPQRGSQDLVGMPSRQLYIWTIATMRREFAKGSCVKDNRQTGGDRLARASPVKVCHDCYAGFLGSTV